MPPQKNNGDEFNLSGDFRHSTIYIMTRLAGKRADASENKTFEVSQNLKGLFCPSA